VVRTSLLPGLLKTIRENRSHALPLRIFETSDVVFKDVTRERQTRNVRHAAALWCNKTAGFEIVHGLLDRAMAMLEVPHIPGGGGGENQAAPTRGYYLKERSGTSVVSSDTTSFTFRMMLISYFFGLVWVLKRRPDILSRSRCNNLLSHGGAHRKN
jgi:phenylalanyl-tRNA synthetase beta chain